MIWTKKETQFLMHNLNIMTDREIAEKLGRSKKSVRGKLRILGLLRTTEARERFRKISQFQKGHRPWNKGIKGLHLSPATEFSKGHKPANTKYDGFIAIRTNKKRGEAYKYIRLSEGNWELYHRYIWQKHNGEIPDSSIVGFKNGDTLDCRIENLYCMSKADNVKRNRDSEKAAVSMKKRWAEGKFLESDNYIAFTLFPRDEKLREEIKQHPELIELKRMQLKLRRAVNESV